MHYGRVNGCAAVALAAGAAAGLCSGSGARAGLVTATWLNPASGTWNVAANWSANPNFPNNGTPAGETYHAVIDAAGAAYTVAVNSSVTVDQITLNSADATLSQTSGTLTVLNGLALNAGHFRLGGGIIANTTISAAGGTMTTLAGTTSVFSNVTLGSDLSVVDGATLAAQSGLTMLPSGRIVVESGGRLNLNTVMANGVLESEAGGELGGAGGTLQDATLVGTITRLAGATNIRGVIENTGVMTYQANQSATYLVGSNSTATLTGGGELVFAGAGTALGLAAAGGMVTNAADHIIRGTGRIFSASGFGGVIVNDGLIVAESGDNLTLDAGLAIQNNGLVRIDAGGRLTLNTALGGVLESTVGGELGGVGGTLRDTTLMGTVTRLSGTTNIQGIINNSGVLTFQSGQNAVYGVANNTMATLAGGGEVVLGGTGVGLTVNGPGGMLINAAGHTIRGGGSVGGGGTLVNEGDILAESGRTLTLGAGLTIQNSGLIRVDAGGVLNLSSNLTSSVPVEINGRLNVNSTAVGGELMFGEGSELGGVNGTLQDTMLVGTVVRQAGSTTLRGTIENTGVLTFQANQSANYFVANNGPATLTGGGELVLAGADTALGIGAMGGMLTNASDHTIRGTGRIANFGGGSFGGALINEGLIVAESGHQVTLGGAVSVDNTGLIEARGGGTVVFDSASTIVNHNNLRSGANGVIRFLGGFSQPAMGVVEVELGGLGATQFGRLTITGAAALDGALALTPVSGFAPDWGDAWTIMTFGSRTGDFASFDLPTLADADWTWWMEANATNYRVGVRHIADLNYDGAINFGDLNIVLGNYNTTGTALQGDINGDGLINFGDLNIVLGLFNLSAPSNVPTPGGVALLACAGGLVARRRRGV